MDIQPDTNIQQILIKDISKIIRYCRSKNIKDTSNSLLLRYIQKNISNNNKYYILYILAHSIRTTRALQNFYKNITIISKQFKTCKTKQSYF